MHILLLKYHTSRTKEIPPKKHIESRAGVQGSGISNWKSVKQLHKVCEFSTGLGNAMDRENISDIKSSMIKGLGERKY